MRKNICWYPIITGVGSWQLLLSQIIISLFLGDRLTLFMISMLTSGGVFMDDRLALLLGERLGLFTNISWLLSSADLADSCLAFLPVERLSFFDSTSLPMSGVRCEAPDFLNSCFELCEGWFRLYCIRAAFSLSACNSDNKKWTLCKKSANIHPLVTHNN